jgi:NAD(P)-dependent dehydrogenase (short-subunit alcohol dehydrogenase family)
VYSVFHVTQAVLPGMLARRSGRIVNLASTAGKWGSRHQSAYNASKHAVVGLTRCLGLELAPHNILVNAICPWIVDTDMATGFMDRHAAIAGVSAAELTARMNATVPLGRWIRPEEVANLALFLASDEASYINGQAWTVDGGYTMI